MDLNSRLLSAITSGAIDTLTFLLDHYSVVLRDLVHLDEALVVACQVGDVEVVNALVVHGADICYTDVTGLKPVHHASRNGQVGVVKYLLRQGAVAANILDLDGWTALHHAADTGHVDVARCLIGSVLTNGQMRIESASNGDQPIHLAAARGHTDIIDMLLTAGCGINVTGGKAMATPLLRAVANKHIEATQFLISRGANIQQSDIKSRRPLAIAAAAGQLEIIRYLLDRIDSKYGVNMKDMQAHTALHFAVGAPENEANIAECLLSAGANVNCVDDRGFSPLHHAAMLNKPSILEVLLTHGAKINLRNEQNGSTPLVIAASQNAIRCVELLVDAGADVNIADANSVSPLHAVFRSEGNDRTDVLKSLVNGGAVLDARDADGMTPLWTCARLGIDGTRFNLADMTLLVEAGADLKYTRTPGHRQTYYRSSPITWLYSYESGMALTYLIEHGWQTWKERHTVARLEEQFPENGTLNRYLTESAHSAQGLRNLCRLTVRRHLMRHTNNGSIRDAVDQLTLPKILKNLVLMLDSVQEVRSSNKIGLLTE